MQRTGMAATVRRVTVATVLNLWPAGPGALAQTPPVATTGATTGTPAEARAQFQAGARHYQAQRYPEAIEAFRTAYQLMATPVILFNLAQAYRADGRLSEAVTTFRQFVTDSPHLSATQRQDVETAIAEIEAQRAVLTFEVEPAGATLVLDGRVVGTLPLAHALEVLPGDHALELRLERHQTRTDSVSLRPHEQRLYTFTLQPTSRSGRIIVQVVPEDTDITLDGASIGVGHVTRDVDPGDHVLSLHRDGYATVTRTLHLGPMASETVDLALETAHRPVVQSPWFWTAVGVGAAAAFTGIWFATHPPGTSPIQGNTPPYVIQSITAQ